MNTVPRSRTSPEEGERIWATFQALMDRRPLQPLDRPAVVTAYEQALDVLGAAYGDHFRRNLRSDPPAAWTEAVAWQCFRQLGWACARYEDPSVGGPDFVIQRDGQEILVECTCLTEQALNAASGLDPARFTEMQDYDSISIRVRTAIASKTKQIGQTEFLGPRLVLIALHDATFPYLDPFLAEDLVAEAELVSVRLRSGDDAVTAVTTLAGSALFRPHGDGIATARHSISGIILMQAYGTVVHLCGILSPHAHHPLQPQVLPQVPWLTVTNQPTEELAVARSWVWLDQSQVRILPHVRELMLSFDGSAAHPAMTVYPRAATRDRVP